MDWYEIKLNSNRSAKFPERALPGGKPDPDGIYIGGIIYDEKWGWITRQYSSDATLLICWLDTGDWVARHTFTNERGDSERCNIRCVEEISSKHEKLKLLGVCVETWDLPDARPSDSRRVKMHIAIYSPTYKQVLRFVQVDGLHVSTLTCIDYEVCRHTCLELFDGCLAIGTDEGTVLLMDMNFQHILDSRNRNILLPANKIKCANIKRISPFALDETSLSRCRKDDEHLVLEMSGPQPKSAVRCLVPVEMISSIAAGLNDGRIAIYDLNTFKLISVVKAPEEELQMAAERLCCIVPQDDPAPCFYICAMYSNGDSLTTALHSVFYQRSRVDSQSNSMRYERVLTCSTRLRLLLDSSYPAAINCNVVSTGPRSGDNGVILVALSWYSPAERKSKLVLFDINQWYKEALPSTIRPVNKNVYMAGYILNGLTTGLALFLKSSSISHFKAMQRYDEHLHPSALTFECSLLTIKGCDYYTHEGVQQRFLNMLGCQNASLFLNPQPCHDEIMRLRLIPQFCELNPDATFSKSAMYEVILSVALENSCIGLLNDCARRWMDGSYLCDKRDPTELSLSTLTNWIVKRASQIKTRSIEIFQEIFDHGGYRLDDAERKEFQDLSWQLRQLKNVQEKIVNMGKGILTKKLLNDLVDVEKAIGVVFEYQRVLFWFVDRDVFPEIQDGAEVGNRPLELIRNFYGRRRTELAKLPRDIDGRSGSTLYIDALLKHRSFGEGLREHWLQNGGDGLYPPTSLKAMLYVMLTQEEQLEQKHEIILYFLLDLNEQLGYNGSIAMDFETAFRVSENLRRSVKSFWHLDHGNYKEAANELFGACTRIRHYQEWQVKLLIDVLLAHKAVNLAAQVVNLPPGNVSPLLRLRVLLANNNMSDAFCHARLYDDDDGQTLLERFFRHCISNRKYKVLAELFLREHEQRLVYRLLSESKSKDADCVQLILLLKRSKYIEAVSFMDKIAAEPNNGESSKDIVTAGSNYYDVSNTILSAYRATMAPVTRNIADTYFNIKDRLDPSQLENKSPVPFSCQLVKQNANKMLGGIFQSSALSVHWATRYQGDSAMISTDNVPFLRHPQYGMSACPEVAPSRHVVRPTPFVDTEKRQRDLEEEGEVPVQRNMQPSKRRRLLGDEIKHVHEQYTKKLTMTNQPSNSFSSATSVLGYCPLPPPAQPPILKRRPIDNTVVTADERQGEEMEVDSDSQGADEIILEIEPAVSDSDQLQASEQLETPIQNKSKGNRTLSPSASLSDSEYLSPLSSANVSFASPPHRQYSGPKPRISLLEVREPIEQTTAATSSEQASSGIGSFEQPEGALHVANTVSLRPGEFVPMVCSSKMHDSGLSHAKMSERTTICVNTLSSNLLREPSSLAEPSSEYRLLESATNWEAVAQPVQMLNTTLGMSSYDLTTLDATHAVQPAPESDVEEVALESSNAPMEEFYYEERVSTHSPNEMVEEQDLDYNCLSTEELEPRERVPSSSFSLCSDILESSSSEGDNRRTTSQLQDDRMYCIVADSTGSITTSRSVTHTPTSFLPSDTNVSQNSSPRDAHGAGDRSPRSLYGANSLETVNDLDTTKGSLEDEEEDDDCVIALDGTEVRSYVPRPSQTAECSSAELFAFKDERKEEAEGKVQSPEDGTANSDSVMVHMDSNDGHAGSSGGTQQAMEEGALTLSNDAASSNASVATVAFSENKQLLTDGDGMQAEESTDSKAVNFEPNAANEADDSKDPDIANASEDTAVDASGPKDTSKARNRRSNSAPPESESSGPRRYALRAHAPIDYAEKRKRRLSNDSDDMSLESGTSSKTSRGSTPLVSTPKPRKPKPTKKLLEVIEEDEHELSISVPLKRSQTRLNLTVDSEAEKTPVSSRRRRATSVSADQDTPPARPLHKLRSNSESSLAAGTKPPTRARRRISQDEQAPPPLAGTEESDVVVKTRPKRVLRPRTKSVSLEPEASGSKTPESSTHMTRISGRGRKH
ncbi:protein ELYS homolog [Scaptodrosophila lebanonensis]|uniref:Protein ELYS homolog n=1 Tax=Drosophila lebanonensis TaxID=7225 RepID=A0A6J2TTR7_DROLE|nr:protein ELYS homolog [Scaptodrosophila lebanonensis]